MAPEISPFRKPKSATPDFWRSLVAVLIAIAVGWGGVVYAANNSVQGAKKEEGGFDGDAPTAILIEASSGSVLFEKNADELRAPSSMMKLMTAEVVFHAIKQGEVKLTDEYRVSENAWRKGGAPSGGSTMFAAIHSKIPVDDLLHGAIILCCAMDASVPLRCSMNCRSSCCGGWRITNVRAGLNSSMNCRKRRPGKSSAFACANEVLVISPD